MTDPHTPAPPASEALPPEAAPPPAAPPPARRPASVGLWAWLRVLLGALAFAVALRAFAFEAYRIPSTSMEDTLLVGDFVLVSKLHYGPRLLGRRLPGFDEVGRGDVVVFHYPPGLEEPLDRRTPYIKRVVGLPGDTLRIEDKSVRAGADVLPFPRTGRQLWEVRVPGPEAIDSLAALGLGGRAQRVTRGTWLVEATPAQAEGIESIEAVEAVRAFVRPVGDGSAAFPAAARFSLDNYGPVAVPEAGATVRLDDASWSTLRTVIERFEGHTLERSAGGFLLDGRPAETYTFDQDYFFVMGDNRDDSADSRTWGFVPRDHFIGKAAVIYYSWDPEAGAPRWGRFGRAVE